MGVYAWVGGVCFSRRSHHYHNVLLYSTGAHRLRTVRHDLLDAVIEMLTGCPSMNRLIDVLTLYTVENGMITWYVSTSLVDWGPHSDVQRRSVATCLSLFFVSASGLHPSYRAHG